MVAERVEGGIFAGGLAGCEGVVWVGRNVWIEDEE